LVVPPGIEPGTYA